MEIFFAVMQISLHVIKKKCIPVTLFIALSICGLWSNSMHFSIFPFQMWFFLLSKSVILTNHNGFLPELTRDNEDSCIYLFLSRANIHTFFTDRSLFCPPASGTRPFASTPVCTTTTMRLQHDPDELPSKPNWKQPWKIQTNCPMVIMMARAEIGVKTHILSLPPINCSRVSRGT